VSIVSSCSFAQKKSAVRKFFAADHPYFQYTGRIDFSNRELPRYWLPGVYVRARFGGTQCAIVVQDEMLGGSKHNYIQVVIDDTIHYRVKLEGKRDTIEVAIGLANKPHTITICKNTETNIGYMEFAGIIAEKLLPPPSKPKRRIEFIGNSITCGTGSDLSRIPCGKGVWEDQHNAYLSYGPTTARNLKAQWQLAAYSGIGLVNSCCNIPFAMPQVYDKVIPAKDSIQWNFKNYVADVVTICLGQNDGAQDSAMFCNAYVQFVQEIRSYYPEARIVLLNSPMADQNLTAVLKNFITSVVARLNKEGDKSVHKYFFSKSFNSGCDGHPDLQEHKQIAKELTTYLKSLMKW
jgi:lysophospholipase L1-like esterase